MRLSLRAKVVLVALVLALIPWLGYVHLKQTEALLRQNQEEALLSTARAIATALRDRPELLEPQTRAASRELDLVLKSLTRAESRIWIVDRGQRLVALEGDLRKRTPQEEKPAPPAIGLAMQLLRPLTALVLDRPTWDFDDALPEAEIANGPAPASALLGVPARRWRHSPDSKAVILSAAYPVWIGDRVAAAVVAEETTNAVRSVYNRALEQLVAVTLLVFIVGALVLVLFASRLSTRLRRLRDEAEAAIDSQGRVRKLLSGSRAGDEIGDLSRSFSTVLDRLAQYNVYLETMAGRLSHELRTPAAVVRSSLENLRMNPTAEEAAVYLARAEEGLKRLETILTRMSEATRLEHMMRTDERERFDAREVVAGCASGYTAAYAGKRFEVDLPETPVPLVGAPDLYAQMLDKLAANAADFATGDEPIRIRLHAGDGVSTLTVSNRGPRLPHSMAGKLFGSMVSVRREAGGGEPHLGLGLYIVRLVAEFHGGSAEALDREDGSGVVLKVSCPLAA